MADPGLARRPLSRTGRAPVEGTGGGAHGGAHHLSFGRGAAAQIRPQIAGPRRADLLLRRRFPGRKLSAPSGLDLRRPLRRQFLSLHDAGLRLFRSRRRITAARWRRPSRHEDPVLRRLLHLRLALYRRPNRGPSSMPSTPAALRSPSSRSSTDKGHDAFLLDEPDFIATTRGFLVAPGPRPAQDVSRRTRRQNVTAASILPPPQTAVTRIDLLLVAGMVETGARVLDVGCGDGELLRPACGHQGRRRARHGDFAKGRQRLRRQGAFGRAGRRRHRSRRLSRRRLRLCHPVADAAGDPQPAAWCWSRCCASASAPSSPSPISAIGASAGSSACGGRMPVTQNLPYAWYETPNIHLCSIRDFVISGRTDRRPHRQGDGAGPRRRTDAASTRRGGSWNLFGEQAVFLLERGDG